MGVRTDRLPAVYRQLRTATLISTNETALHDLYRRGSFRARKRTKGPE